MSSHTASQRYLSTRGGSYDLSFEEVVLKGLAADGGLFLPTEIPSLPAHWEDEWVDLSFQDLAFRIFSCYISSADIPPADLQRIIEKSYSTFREPEIIPTISLDEEKKLYLLELFHGPTFAFKDVALQFLGNLFEFFLVRKNEGKTDSDREHLTVIGATSGDTGSAAIYGLRSKKDISVFITYPTGKISPVQESQMTSVPDANVHCLSVDGTFDDCQDFVKALFGDPIINSTLRLGAVNSINWARILAQITYYFYSYFSLRRKSVLKSPGDQVRFVVPTGNFGDILAGYFAKRMGLPIEKLVIACNPNDILHRFWQTGSYEKNPIHGTAANGGFPEDGVKAHADGVKESYSPAMDILISSNFERLLWFLAYDVYGSSIETTSTGATAATEKEDVHEKRRIAGSRVKQWQTSLKTSGGFSVDPAILSAARQDFISERVSDSETLSSIREVYRRTSTGGDGSGSSGGSSGGYVLDPHSAIGVTASLRSISSAPLVHISLATAHPAKFSNAVDLALADETGFQFERDVLPPEFVGLDKLPKRITYVQKSAGLEGIREIIKERVPV